METLDESLAIWIVRMQKEKYSDLDILFSLLAGVEVMKKAIEAAGRETALPKST